MILPACRYVDTKPFSFLLGTENGEPLFMVASDIKYVVQLKTKETKDGKFRPSVSVIRQDGRNFNTMTIDLDNGALFVAESAAIK